MLRLDRKNFSGHLDRRINQAISQLLYQRPGTKKLTSGAEVDATVLHRDPLDGAAANIERVHHSIQRAYPLLIFGYLYLTYLDFAGPSDSVLMSRPNSGEHLKGDRFLGLRLIN
jgi:hypothetical protein